MTHRTEAVENDNMSVIGIGRLVALALLASATLGPALAQQQQKPIILVIMADDIGYWNISAYNRGMMGYRTPNIDRVSTASAAGFVLGRTSAGPIETPAVPQLSEQARRPHREAQEDPSKSNVTLNATKMTANTLAASHRTRR
jgi:hypothetical protein